jgi:hypothetical protein
MVANASQEDQGLSSDFRAEDKQPCPYSELKALSLGLELVAATGKAGKRIGELISDRSAPKRRVG